MKRTSLRRELLIPVTVLVIGVSVAIAWVSMKAGTDAVQTLTQRVLTDMVNRISNATERHLEGALIALESISPDPRTVPREQVFSDDMRTLEINLWAASGLFMNVNNYVYYGGEDGRFVGVYRIKNDFVELFWHEPGDGLREVYNVASPGDRTKLLRTEPYDPRKRPWYRVASVTDKPVWSAIYNNFTAAYPTITLAKAVFRKDHSLAGVVATDVTLKVLSDFLKTLEISKNSVAYILDAEGHIVATSGQESPVKMVDGMPVHMMATEMKTSLISETYKKSFEWQRQILQKNPDVPSTRQLELSVGTVDVAVSSLGNRQGLSWLTVVAVPRSDFMSGINQGFMQSALIAIACIIIALTIGVAMVERVVRDIRKLTGAAEKFGNGEPLPALDIQRGDEIGTLAQTFIEMENKLRFDKLTQVANRESLFAQINYLRKQAALNAREAEAFTLLFVDLDRFKFINDTYGHDAGDKVLVIIAARLQAAIRDTDLVARYGGDEFVLLLKEVKGSIDISSTVEKICALVEEPIALEGAIVSVGVSIGWASFPDDGDDYVRLIKIADGRMYKRKRDRKSNQLHLV
ncbi:diguanylate cyclase domain-containing protein [Undibacterium sp.]|jgi:diguanylate cyclase (GGDEF)-like protein|uniref:diguanylate cyclase domain-containing protein n=1 Tax=Undibacterium sp. TaxID=1914977 RepID=UPI002CED5618|nr:diguanylate cyclase [Undibacterium sp.]HTD04316.1 diguanylate cyclase [Undibacterium sp.]